ncbi:MAG: radical SAM protein [Nanobdellota archaeon]
MSQIELVLTKKTHCGPLAKGCDHCVKGRKSVFFVTGLCHYRCFYCPISDDKRYKDIVKINEQFISTPDSKQGIDQAIEEIKLCQSSGVGITGGDPLLKLDRVCTYIKAFKEKFGSSFHIHLYTTLDHVTQEALLQLESAGLDEIRFHFNVQDILLWEKVHFAEGSSMDVGVEIPVVPGFKEKTKELISFCAQLGFITFINLNELEYSDASQERFDELGLVVKDDLSYAIEGSEELALELVEFGKQKSISTHYCSAEFKDKVQLGNRLRLRSQSVAREFDDVNEQGMLYRGVLRPISDTPDRPFTKDVPPLTGDVVEDEIDTIVQNKGLLDVGVPEKKPSQEIFYEGFTLHGIRKQLMSLFDIPEDLIEVDGDRIITGAHILKEIWPQVKRKRTLVGWKKHFKAELVVEYPTSDHFPLEREEL